MNIHFQRDSKRMFRFILSILLILAVPMILSSLLSCRVSVEGDHHYQGSGSPHLSKIEGPWLLNANNLTGRLEIYRTRNVWTGQMRFDSGARWIQLTDIFFDPHTGRLEFRLENQIYSGTLSGNRIVGTFGFAATVGSGVVGSYPWEAWRQ
jgi:hypothetical protein